MDRIYLVCAVFGATLWVCLFVLSLFGIDHGHGADSVDSGDVHSGEYHGHGNGGHGLNWLAGLFSIRGLIAAITFFGVGGLAGTYGRMGFAPSLGVAIACAIAAMVMVSAVFRLLLRTTHDGTLHVRNAVGQVGTVYLRVPGGNAGRGKVTVKVQDRLVELQAVSSGAELPTGAQVVVVNVVGPDTVEVIPAVV